MEHNLCLADLDDGGAVAAEECNIASGGGLVVVVRVRRVAAEERKVSKLFQIFKKQKCFVLSAPPGAGLHRVKDLVEVAADCPLQLGPGLVKLSQACPHNYNCQTPAAQLYTSFMLLYEVQMAFYDH